MMGATDRTSVDSPTLLTFEAFFRSEYPRLVRMLCVLCGDRGRAEDLSQDALAQAHRDWDRVSAYECPGAWVRRVALNRSVNAHRSQRRESAALDRLGTAVVGNVVEFADADLWRAVRKLPEKQRWVVVLFYVADASVADIAETLGCTVGTVKTHLSRARKTLATILRQPPEPT